MDKRTRCVLDYHERTKHHPHRPAKSPGFMDWSNQPKPFRFYEGAAKISLPLMETDPPGDYAELYKRAKKPAEIRLENIAGLLELSLGLSAWKSLGGDKWALRMNPSSGNLHPTEAYLILPPMEGIGGAGLCGGVFHYNAFPHALEERATFGGELWKPLKRFGDGFFVALTSVYWREAWKYGERAFRYCNHDVGHAVAAVSFAAALQGWRVKQVSVSGIGKLLGFHKTEFQETESPDLLLYVGGSARAPEKLPDIFVEEAGALDFAGTPNRLSQSQVEWAVIGDVSKATETSETGGKFGPFSDLPFIGEERPELTGAEIIRRRRSAQRYDEATHIGRKAFFAMLDRTVPRNGRTPFDAGIGTVSIHLLLFVHRVKDMEPGIYLLFRDARDEENLREKCGSGFEWRKVKAPKPLLLYRLVKRDFRIEAAAISCRQSIAGDGAFSIGMIAKFRALIETEPSNYRKLFWEAGMIGQILYLEAEALGIRGTGIGCFFDDMVHELLGFSDDSWQSIYHFTVGGPVEDERLTTLPPYHHLKKG